MSDEHREDPVVDANATQELTPEELNKVAGGGLASIVQSVVDQAITLSTPPGSRDVAGGMPTGKRQY